MNYIYSFIIFEAGAFFGFFVAALLNAARAGQEITIKFEEEDNGTDREHLVGAENCAGTVSAAQKYEEEFHQPEAFLPLGRRLMVIPVPDESVQNDAEKAVNKPPVEHDR